jgi:multicomponent Na+:H+ antiporter subunit G
VRAIIYDIMLIVSLCVMTLGIVGIVRMPDIYTKLHGASKSVFLGVVLLCASATVVATEAMIYRIILIALLVVMTTPISSHVIGHAAYRLQERMETPGAVDESHLLVPDEKVDEPTWRL